MSPTAADRLAERVSALRGGIAYQAYLEARDAVLRMMDLSNTQPSAYWRHELNGFEYMLDASPLLIERLRHHSFHVTGLRTYDYRPGKDAHRRRLADKLLRLREIGDERHLVPESPQLGGFGHEIEGELYNLDTLKFFEAMIALDRCGALATLASSSERSVIWEIGAGWGGFARVLKTAVPNSTYVICDLPELYLFSGPYLRTLMPDARVRYWRGEDGDELFADWEEIDFILVPAAGLSAITPPRLDLVVNMVSFQEMTTEQVRGYLQHALGAGAQTVYSLNRDRSGYNTELSSLRELMGEHLALEEIVLLEEAYTSLGPRRAAPLRSRVRRALRTSSLSPGGAGDTNSYRHIVGRPRSEPGPHAR